MSKDTTPTWLTDLIKERDQLRTENTRLTAENTRLKSLLRESVPLLEVIEEILEHEGDNCAGCRGSDLAAKIKEAVGEGE